MLGKIQEEHRSESVYSASGSSKHSGNKRKPTQSSSMVTSGMSEIRQRVLSARILRFKTVQNQLTLAQQQIHELEQENRGLKTTVRRQERALDKYDNANAELPRLLKNHQEEIRVWHEKSKVLHKSITELSVKLKQKDSALLVATDQNKHLQQLNRDRQLEDRVKLTEQVKDLQQSLVERDNELKLLARKYQLETKMLRSQLHQETAKGKDLQKKLDASNMEITRLNLLELNNGRSALSRYRNLRESHSASTNISYRQFPSSSRNLKVPSSCSESYYSKSPLCDSYRNEILYEDQVAEEEDVDFQQKIREFEQQKKLHLQQVQSMRQQQQAREQEEEENNFDLPQTELVNEKVATLSLTAAPNDEADPVAQFQSMNRKDIREKELILDAVCESVLVQSPGFGSSASSSSGSSPSSKKSQISRSLRLPDNQGKSKKQPIDPKSKTKLLAALKAIDSNESFES